jgi:DNA-binding NarL/FixJ family response regulator
MLGRITEGEPSFSARVVAAYARPARRQLAIVDNSQLRCDCLKLALAQAPRRWQASDFAEVSELMRLIRHGEEFDVVLMGGATSANIDLADVALLAGAAPHSPILVVADGEDPARAHAILRAGARGFLPTSHSLKILLGALERVRAGMSYVPLSLAETDPAGSREGAHQTPWRELTPRQRDVLELIAEGKPNKLIANALSMSESTVKAHVKQIIRRLNVANRTQAALLATRTNRGH